MNKEERLKILLWNAVSLLATETFEQYDNAEEWVDMLMTEMCITKEELEEYCGITFGENGNVEFE